MERSLALRPGLVYCALASAWLVAGCGPSEGYRATPVDGGTVTVAADVGAAGAVVATGERCAPGSTPCAAGSSCRRPDGRDDARCIADGALFGRCRERSTVCEPGLGCEGSGPAARCVGATDGGPTAAAADVRASAPSDAGTADPRDATLSAGCSIFVDNSCPADAVCLSREGTLRCVARGSAAAPCRADGSCDPGFGCDRYRNCVVGSPAGAACSWADPPCAAGLSCLLHADSLARCTADGTRFGLCGAGRATCPAGLTCATNPHTAARCLPVAVVGEDCDGTGVADVCALGATCLPHGAAHRCFADGALGGACGSACAAGLRCDAGRCRRPVAIGDACGELATAGLCPAGSSCEGDGASARCVLEAAEGGRCRPSSPRCDADLECSGADAFGSPTGLCRRLVQDGGACDVAARSTVCVGMTSCAPDVSGLTGVCARPGTRAGARCRPALPQCDGELQCLSPLAPSLTTCQRLEPLGAPCDREQRTVLCAGRARCAAVTGAGACTVETPEVEPNDGDGHAQVVTGSLVVVSGQADYPTTDCFAVTTPANASILVTDEVFTYRDVVGARVSLLDATGAELAGTGTGTRIDPEYAPAARNLAAGRHVVCVRAVDVDFVRYLLIIAVTTPAS